MAYASRGGSSRGGSSRGGGGGGGANATAYAVAGVLVVLVVVLFLVLNKKKAVPTRPPPATPTPAPVAQPPPKPGEKPYPTITEAVVAEARALVASFAKDANAADALYVASLKAKEAGDLTTWQAKLHEANNLYHGINSRWNDFVDRLPTGNGYDTEDVAKHYFPRESGQLQTYVKNMRAMKTDLK